MTVWAGSMWVLPIDIRRADNHNCDGQAFRMTRAVSILADSCFCGKDEFDMILRTALCKCTLMVSSSFQEEKTGLYLLLAFEEAFRGPALHVTVVQKSILSLRYSITCFSPTRSLLLLFSLIPHQYRWVHHKCLSPQLLY